MNILIFIKKLPMKRGINIKKIDRNMLVPRETGSGA